MKFQVIVGNSGGSVEVDSALDADSRNPVQNRVITAALGALDGGTKITDTDDGNAEYAVSQTIENGRIVTTYTAIN